MPYNILWKDQTVYAQYYGQVTDHEIARFARDVQADHRFESLRFVIEDFLDCADLTYSHDVLEELSATDGAASKTNPLIKVAVITESQKVMDMVYTYMSKGMVNYPIRIFPSVVLALNWFRSHVGK